MSGVETDGIWALYRARRNRTETEGHTPCEGCGGRSVHYDPDENVGLCESCAEGVAEGQERSDPPADLTHEWTAVHIQPGELHRPWPPGAYVMGGQPHDEGRPRYVLHVQEADGDVAVAAEQIAAALRGEG